MTIAGTCLCGAVRFEIATPTEFVSHCHCQSCRRAHGAAFVTWTSVPAERFRLLQGYGLLRRYESSPGVGWEFCGACGSSMLYRADHTPGRVYVAAASLEGPLDREPEGHHSYEEHVPWLEGCAALPRFLGKTEERWVQE